jgi:hypothetical protein
VEPPRSPPRFETAHASNRTNRSDDAAPDFLRFTPQRVGNSRQSATLLHTVIGPKHGLFQSWIHNVTQLCCVSSTLTDSAH